MKSLLLLFVVSGLAVSNSFCQPDKLPGSEPVEAGKTYTFTFPSETKVADPVGAQFRVLRLLKEPWIEVEKSYITQAFDSSTKQFSPKEVKQVFRLNLNGVLAIYPMGESKKD